ncbi:MAG: BMC domain-containing protein [Candidatus Zhuqueibacterota bacterium]
MEPKNSIGIIELASIHKGFEVQDAVLKVAEVEKIIARTICSGKYLIIIRGQVADVETCIETAKVVGGFAIVNAVVIPRVDERVFPAIAGANTLNVGEPVDGLLVIETFSVASAIKAADFAVKEANIELVRVHIAMAVGGKGFVVMTGDMEALKSAVVPAIEYIKDDGMLAGYSLISHPHEEVLKELI